MKRRGFTLIELLVVVMVIAAVTALLLPSLSQAGDGARKARCLNNLMQVGRSFALYQEDWDGSFPPQTGRDKMPWGYTFTRGGYIDSRQVMLCPSAADMENSMDFLTSEQSWTFGYISYGYNYVYLGSTLVDGRPSLPQRNFSEADDPENTVLVADARFRPDLANRPSSVISTVNTGNFIIHDRHGASANVLWVDGRATEEESARESIQVSKYLTLKKR